MNKDKYYHFGLYDAVVFLTVFMTFSSIIKKYIGERKQVTVKLTEE